MRDQKAMLRLCRRRPRPHPRIGAGLRQINGRVATELMLAAVVRHRSFRAFPSRVPPAACPSEQKPSTDQVLTNTARGFGSRARWVSRSAMWMPLTPSVISRAQSSRVLRLVGLHAKVAGDVQQRLLDEPRHHAGIGAAARHRGDAARIAPARLQKGLAQRIVGARLRPEFWIEVKARPGLGNGVDVERSNFAGELHDGHRTGVDRQVDAKAAAAARGEQRREQVAVIFAGDGLMDETELAVVQHPAILVIRGR